VLVPWSSSTSVAAWTWPTWVVSRRRVLEAVFVLLESPSSRRIFIGSHSPPPLVRHIGPSPNGQHLSKGFYPKRTELYPCNSDPPLLLSEKGH
jgi:hypothetical protein